MSHLSRSTVATFKMIIHEGGVRGLWRGTGPTVIRLSCGAAVNMVILERLKGALLQQLENGATHLSSTNAALVGGLSRAVSAACMSPVTLVKTRMEYGGPGGAQYRNTLHAMQTIVKQDGVRGLFRGIGPTVLTNAPFSALYYMFYTRMKGVLAAEDRPQTLVNFGSAVTAAVAATLITQPTDVVRTRMQLALAGTTKGNALQTMAHVFASQGPKALLSGAAPRVLKRTTQTALVWTLYEELLPRMSALWAWTEQLATDSVGRPAAGGPAASAGSQ
jgi:solute carrier family 25 protein 38